MPLLMESVVGGVDIDGPTLFSMDPVGSLIPDPFITAGSGAPIAMGLVEAKYSESMDLEAGAKLALDAIRSAVARDVVSGDGVDILLIRRDETEERTHTTKS